MQRGSHSSMEMDGSLPEKNVFHSGGGDVRTKKAHLVYPSGLF